MVVLVAGFFLSYVLSMVTKVQPAAYGCLLPVAATVLWLIVIIVWPQGSMDAVSVPFVFLFGAAGSISGAFVAGMVRTTGGEKL
jgi:hypothetical protein